MSMSDPIADLLTRIRNAQMVAKATVLVPSSKVKIAIAQVLKDEGYIDGFQVKTEAGKSELEIALKYYAGRPVIERIERVSRPGLRVYKGRGAIPQVMNGLGVAIVTTATPEYVSGVVLIAVLASATAGVSPVLAEWGWISGKTLFPGTATSAMDDITFMNFFLPVMTIALYGIGYIARMTRASMTEVMTQQYIRTARLKGVGFRQIIIKHALRNALIAPFTVIMLQFPWLLNGVVIVETLFNYKGFGWTLVQAAGNNDIQLLLGCSVVAVFVVLITQLISDVGYVFLNPRIRLN